MPGHSPEISTDGYTVVPQVVGSVVISSLIESLSRVICDSNAREKSRDLYAMRNLLQIPEIRVLARSSEMRRVIEPVLGKSARPVRGILFDKTPQTNWKVAWHQDLSIAVKRRVNVAGFGPWSIKAGVQHVQPPVEVLENMITLRLHLDDCDDGNGPLRVLPGSHAEGILTDDAISQWRQTTPVSCICPVGGAVLMRPLLLHASSQATTPRHRRVIHLEYAIVSLPGGLEWFEE